MLIMLCLFKCLLPCQIMYRHNAMILEPLKKAFLVLKSNWFSILTLHLKITPYFSLFCILTQSFFIAYCFFWIFKLSFCFLTTVSLSHNRTQLSPQEILFLLHYNYIIKYDASNWQNWLCLWLYRQKKITWKVLWIRI